MLLAAYCKWGLYIHAYKRVSRMYPEKVVENATHQPKLFPAGGRMELVAMELVGYMLMPSNGNQFMLVITDRYPNITRAVPTSKTTAAHIASLLINH